uniref:Uncharacterized protein n=1 Tax=Coccidioides posadasii RMSCC 3488 TaxID=454284 RepID=A0A0J6I3V4_COCPO|nr:hypothetical protein CPAG_02402 [Coccidioides posadasii RMSCC 3488]
MKRPDETEIHSRCRRSSRMCLKGWREVCQKMGLHRNPQSAIIAKPQEPEYLSRFAVNMAKNIGRAVREERAHRQPQNTSIAKAQEPEYLSTFALDMAKYEAGVACLDVGMIDKLRSERSRRVYLYP